MALKYNDVLNTANRGDLFAASMEGAKKIINGKCTFRLKISAYIQTAVCLSSGTLPFFIDNLGYCP